MTGEYSAPSTALLRFRSLLGFEREADDLRGRLLAAYDLIDPVLNRPFGAREKELLRDRLGEAYELAYKLCDLYDEARYIQSPEPN